MGPYFGGLQWCYKEFIRIPDWGPTLGDCRIHFELLGRELVEAASQLVLRPFKGVARGALGPVKGYPRYMSFGGPTFIVLSRS